MAIRIIKIFILASGILLLLTGAFKFVSAFGGAHILLRQDPIFAISFRELFCVAGLIELAVAATCLFGKNCMLRIVLIVWISTSFAAYRLGLVWVAYKMPCNCLGSLTEVLHIPPQTADMAMKIILAFFLIGSYASLFWLWRQKYRLVAGRSKMEIGGL